MGTEETFPAGGEEIRFSDALAELESIVKELEGGDLDLEEAIAKYERGVALLGICRDRLGSAQQKITTLVGELEEEPGETGDDVDQ